MIGCVRADHPSPPWGAINLAPTDLPSLRSASILCEHDLFFCTVAVQGDRELVYAFNLPAFLGVNPGIGFGFVGTAHAAYDALAQVEAQLRRPA